MNCREWLKSTGVYYRDTPDLYEYPFPPFDTIPYGFEEWFNFIFDEVPEAKEVITLANEKFPNWGNWLVVQLSTESSLRLDIATDHNMLDRLRAVAIHDKLDSILLENIIRDPANPERVKFAAVVALDRESPVMETLAMDPAIPLGLRLEIIDRMDSRSPVLEQLVMDTSQPEKIRMEACKAISDISFKERVAVDPLAPIDLRLAAIECLPGSSTILNLILGTDTPLIIRVAAVFCDTTHFSPILPKLLIERNLPEELTSSPLRIYIPTSLRYATRGSFLKSS